MRKLTLAALLFIFAAAANAQFSKGDRYLGGSFQISVADADLGDNDVENFYVSLSPSFTRFKSDRRASGFKLTASYFNGYSSSSGSNTKTSQWTFGAGLFWQRYLLLGKGFYLSGELGVNAFTGFGWQEYLAPPSTNDIKTYSANVYITPALGYKLTNRLLIGLQFNNLALLGFTHENAKYTSGGMPITRKTNSLQLSSSANTTNLGNLGLNFAWKLR